MRSSSASNGHARVKPACVSKLSEFLTVHDVRALRVFSLFWQAVIVQITSLKSWKNVDLVFSPVV